jgi:hypothetical protein
MSWTAGADVSTGQLITAAQWNNYLGASGSLEYLNDFSHTEPTRSFDTVYQNGSSIRIISICFNGTSGDGIFIKTDTSNPPTTVVATVINNSSDNNTLFAMAIIQPSHYYKVQSISTPVKDEWHEWN